MRDATNNIWTFPLGDIVRSHGLSCHFYADDTQLYCSFKRHDQVASVKVIESCLNDIDAWMLANMLKLNRDKTELLVIGPKHKVNPPIKGIHVAGDYIEVSSIARNILRCNFWFPCQLRETWSLFLPWTIGSGLFQNCAEKIIRSIRSDLTYLHSVSSW